MELTLGGDIGGLFTLSKKRSQEEFKVQHTGWLSLFGHAGAYPGLYCPLALALRATTVQIGLLCSVPSLAMALSQPAAPHLAERAVSELVLRTTSIRTSIEMTVNYETSRWLVGPTSIHAISLSMRSSHSCRNWQLQQLSCLSLHASAQRAIITSSSFFGYHLDHLTCFCISCFPLVSSTLTTLLRSHLND